MAVAAMLLALPIGCRRNSPSGEVVTVRFWNGFTGPDGRAMLKLIKQFNASNPHVNVIMQRMAWSQYYNKLFVAGIGKRAPEVFVTHRSALRRFVGAGFVRPVDDLLGDGPDQLRPNDFDANILSAVVLNGKHWAIPLDVHPLGMYYNRALLKRAGIVDAHGNAKAPTNRHEFLQVLQKLKPAAGADPAKAVWGYAFTWQRNEVYSVMRQFGGDLFDPSLTHSTFASPQNIAALDWCAGLIRDGLAPPPQEMDSWVRFRQGKVAIVFQGIFMVPELQRQTDLDWGAAPMPVLGDTPAAWADSHSLVLRKDLDAKHLDASKRLIKFLSDHSLDWAEGGQVPVRKSLRDTARFRAMTAQSEFARQIPYVAYFPPTPYIFEYLAEFDLAVERALRGTQPASAALATADANVAKVMLRYQAQKMWDLSEPNAADPTISGSRSSPGGAR
jgi:multiple sugar transport system substrate-binding protein